MKNRVIYFFIAISLLVTNCNVNAAVREEACPMGLFENIRNCLDYDPIRKFLEKRGILTDDKEAYDYAYAFLDLALKRDINAMKDLFAPNAISEISEIQLDEMLIEFVGYFEADSFTLEIPIDPSTSERWDHGMKSKELKGPLEIVTDKNEYRFAIKCIAYDDFDENNIGIWSVYIIEKSMDTDLEHPYIGDKKYRSGVYMNVNRPDEHTQ